MLKIWVAALLAVFNIANGLLALFDAPGWYASVPGASATGDFNPHFVQDIGAAFLAAGLGLAARAWRERYWPAAMAGAVFLVSHALIHIWGMGHGDTQFLASDLAFVVAPALLAVWAALPRKAAAHV